MALSPVVRTSRLHKKYRQHHVLHSVDLEVDEGSVFALLGPNGAGKTTIVNVLSTLKKFDGGTAQVAGHDVAAAPAAVRRAVSVTGQFAALDKLLTGRENLTMMAKLNRVPRKRLRTYVDELLERFDLTDAADRRVQGYSGGMTRRLDLAVSMLARPRVLFLDEPTTGLDPRSRQAVWDFVRELVGDGVTVFLTTQYLEEADRLADRVAVLDAGRVVADDTPTALKKRVGTDLVDVEYADGETASLHTDGTFAGVRHVIAGIDDAARPVASIAIRTPSLDDVFLSLTGRTSADSKNGTAA